MAERTFDDREIKELMERAAQLQASQDDRSDLGLTLAELEQIAAESGIEPSFLRTAVREADSGIGLRNVRGKTGTHVFVERTVSGTLGDDEWHNVVMRLRDQYGSDTAATFGGSAIQTQGVSEQLGSTREWRHTTVLGVATTVSIRSLGYVQHLRIRRRVGLGTPVAEGIGYGALIALFASFVAGEANGSALIGFIVLAAALLILIPSITWLDRKWRSGKLEEINAVADDIARIIHNKVDEVEESQEWAVTPAISLDDLPDVEDVGIHPADSEKARS